MNWIDQSSKFQKFSLIVLFNSILNTEVSANALSAHDLFEPKFSIVYQYEGPFQHFGASVSLASSLNDTSNIENPWAWIFIGSPTADTDEAKFPAAGLIWRCRVGKRLPTYQDYKHETCKRINLDPYPEKRVGLLEMKNAWTGVSLENSDNLLVTCAHRNTRQMTTMHGICYYLLNYGGERKRQSFASLEGPEIPRSYTHRLQPFFSKSDKEKSKQIIRVNVANKTYPIPEWRYGQFGTSLHISKNSNGKPLLLAGAPSVRSWSGAALRYSNLTKQNAAFDMAYFGRILEGKKDPSHEDEYFGYSVSSGRYLDKNALAYAAGIPRGKQLLGSVVIFDFVSPAESEEGINILQTLHQGDRNEFFGSYFGAVLHTADINGDGQDELLVGAPFYSLSQRPTRFKRRAQPLPQDSRAQWKGEHGCVVVFYFEATNITSVKLPRGEEERLVAPGSRFGSAISSLRMNNNENYIVIGSPFDDDGQGAVYIYNKELRFVQKISASEIAVGSGLRGLGSAISLPVDVDDNMTPDIAIGAYNSQQVVILRTRPIAFLEGDVKFYDYKNGRVYWNSTQIWIHACAKLKSLAGLVTAIDIGVHLSLDKRFFNVSIAKGRVEANVHQYNMLVGVSDEEFCQRFTVQVNNTDPSRKYLPYVVNQTLWYSSVPKDNTVLHYTIPENGDANVTGETGWNDDSRVPYEIPRRKEQFLGKIVWDCADNKCKPKLRAFATWLDLSNGMRAISQHDNPVISLRGFQQFGLRISITNDGDSAFSPNFRFDFSNSDITVVLPVGESASDEFSLLDVTNCVEENYSGKTSYECIGPDILENSWQNFTIYFSARNFFADTTSTTFQATLFDHSQNHDHQYLVDSSNIVTLKSKMKLIINGTKNDGLRKDLITPDSTRSVIKHKELGLLNDTYTFTQSYRVWNHGNGGASVKVKINFPYAQISDNSNKNQSWIFPVPSDTNHFCKLLTSDYSLVDRLIPDDVPPGKDSVSAGADSEDHGVLPQNIETNGTSMEDDGRTTQDAPILQSSNALTLSCVNYPVMSTKSAMHLQFTCVQIECLLKIQQGRSVDISFDVYMSHGRVDEILRQTPNMDLLFLSHGTLSLLNKTQLSSDFAETLFRSKSPQQISSWIYFVSTLLGLLQLSLLVFLLYKCGFFKRENKRRLTESLESEAENRRSTVPTVSPMPTTETEDIATSSESDKTEKTAEDQMHSS